MKSTMSLNWQSLVSKIHPPLSMSPRESARLLALLNTSFKRQLDRQHPSGIPDSEHHTDIHLRSILTNPLFDAKSTVRRTGSMTKTLGRVQDLMKRPMDVFTEQVSEGTATLQTARFCLQVQYNNCLASPDTTLANSMRASRAGTIVLKWLSSSGLETSRQLFESQELLGLLVGFLVAERQNDQISLWIRRLYDERSHDQLPGRGLSYRKLFLAFVKAEVTTGQGLESATTWFIQIARELRSSEIVNHGLYTELYNIANYLTLQLINIPKTAKLQASTLDPLMELTHTITIGCRPFSRLAAFQSAYLARRPRPNAALHYFRELPSHQIAKLSPPGRTQTIFLGLKAAELCLDRGRQAEAIQIMDFLQTYFGSEVGSHGSSKRAPSPEGSSHEAEDRSLRQLDSLAIA